MSSRLNYGKTFLLGFGFFGVSVIWGVYNADYVYGGGTSMATPLVAGAAGALLLAVTCPSLHAAEKLKALIVDGQNNHAWKATTPPAAPSTRCSGVQPLRAASTDNRTPPLSVNLKALERRFFRICCSRRSSVWPKGSNAVPRSVRARARIRRRPPATG